MTTPLLFDFLNNIFVGFEKKITGELVNWLFALIVLPAARWVGKIFSRQRKRTENRRELESLKLLYELEQTFGNMPPEHHELYRQRYQTLLAQSEDMRKVIPEVLVPEDPVESALSEPEPPTREEGSLSFLDWVFALSAPGLYVLVALTSTEETFEFRALMFGTAILGGIASVLLAYAWFAGPRERGIGGAFVQIFWSVFCYFAALVLVTFMFGFLGIEIPGLDDPVYE